MTTHPVKSVPEQDAADKWDDGKLPLELIPEEFIEELGIVYQVGLKYGRENWKKGLSFRRMKGAMMRHLNDFYKGENLDQGDGQHHLAAVAFYCAAIIYFQARGRIDLDDREIVQ